MKRQIPLVLVLIFGLFMVVQYFIPHESSEWIYEYLLDWITIIGVFALVLGIWSLFKVNYDKISQRKSDRGYSMVLLVSLFASMFFGFFAKVDGSWGLHFSTAEGLQSYMYRHAYEYIIRPIQSTIFSLLAFFIASAAYRAFRARNVLASLLLIASLIVMLRFNPYLGSVGDYISDGANWLLNVPNLAAKRAIVIGIGLGMVATALKVILGIERSYMGKG